MRVCYFGTYERDYPRNRTLVKGLRHAGVDVVEVNDPMWRGKTHKVHFGVLGYLFLLVRYPYGWLRLLWRALRTDFDCLVVGYPGQFDVPAAWLLCRLRRKPLVFDAFLSIYDSFVCDRGVVRRGSLFAAFLHAADRWACRGSDAVLLDTDQDIRFFQQEFRLQGTRFVRIWVGCDDEVFAPRAGAKLDAFTVCFHGKYIPLQGVEYILQAARILKPEGVRFRVTGTGQMYDALLEYVRAEDLDNVELHGLQPIEGLPKLELPCHVGFGVFGHTEKARRVIPNKVYETLAMGLPLVTGDSAAVRELLVHERDCLLCEMADPDALAKAIRRLRDDPALRVRLAAAGRATYLAHATPARLGRTLAGVIEDLVRR